MFPVGDILLHGLRNLSRKSVGLPREECRKDWQGNGEPRNEEGRLPILWFLKLGIFKNWALGIDCQNNLLHFLEMGLRLHFILSNIVLDFTMNRSWVLNVTFWTRLKANNTGKIKSVDGMCYWSSGSQWERSGSTLFLPHINLFPFFFVLLLLWISWSQRKNWDRVRRASDVGEGRNR